MAFDFDAAVSAPFRMQPGLRRLAPGAGHLTPLAPGSRHQREKLAVLSAFWPQALLARDGYDAAPALHALASHAATEHPNHFAWDGRRAASPRLGAAVNAGQVEQLAAGSFGLGDEVARCLRGLPDAWRLAGLLSLTFAEDFALVDGSDGTLPWLAVTLPSHWAPEQKVGRHFTAVHAPVADNALLLKAADSLLRLVTDAAAEARWERFVWTITDHPRLHAHPARVPERRWQDTPVERAWFRSERQSFIPLVPAVGGRPLAVFTIEVDTVALADVVRMPGRAAALHSAVSTMSDAVLAYRGLVPVRDALLGWLATRAAEDTARPRTA